VEGEDVAGEVLVPRGRWRTAVLQGATDDDHTVHHHGRRRRRDVSVRGIGALVRIEVAGTVHAPEHVHGAVVAEARNVDGMAEALERKASLRIERVEEVR